MMLYEKKYVFGSILETVNIMGIKIMEQVEQFMVIFIPKNDCLSKKFKVEYLLS